MYKCVTWYSSASMLSFISHQFKRLLRKLSLHFHVAIDLFAIKLSVYNSALSKKKKWCKQHFALRKNMHMIQERNSKWKQYVANNSKTILCQSMKQWLIFFYLVFVVIHVCIVYLLFSTEDYLKLPFYQSKIPSEIRGYASIFSIFCVKKRQNS